MIKINSFMLYQIISVIFVIILGTVLHFTFGWSGEIKIVGAFSAVNESTWEHLKLIFFPMLITTIIGYYLFGEKVLCAKTIGIITSMLFIIIFFYTYTGIIGTNYSIVDIGSFFIAVFLGEYVAYRIFEKERKCNSKLAILILLVLLLCFIIFTYNPPKINLFKDPITGLYGI